MSLDVSALVDKIEIDLSIGVSPEITATEIERCIDRSVEDINRFYPDEAYYEYAVNYEISDESWTSATAHGTYTNLANKPIKPLTETVTSADGATTYERDVDYTIDYINGRITTISTGDMLVETEYLISYTKSKITVNISSLTGLIRVVDVELVNSTGNIPQKKVGFEIFGDILYIGSQGMKTSQQELSSSDRIIIYYDRCHVKSTDYATIPTVMEQIISIGAIGYCYLLKAAEYRFLSATDLASSRTALTTMAMTEIEAALGAVSTLQTDLDTALGEITTALEDAATYCDDAVSAAPTAALTAWLNGGTIPSVAEYLKVGDDLINTSNDGKDVAENYAKYADACNSAALTLSRVAEVLGNVAMSYANTVSQIARKAEQIVNAMAAYVNEGQQRIGEQGLYVQQSIQYIANSEKQFQLAESMEKIGQAMKSEFWSILKDKAEWRRKMSSSSLRQNS